MLPRPSPGTVSMSAPSTATAPSPEPHVDVLIVGAGLSGIGAAVHLQKLSPDRSYAIVEARPRLGGTWDLFRYPGIRSDSDMHTLGYSFAPWTDAKAIADGPAILDYVRKTAEDHGIGSRIRYGQRVRAAAWSTADARWTVEIQDVPSGAIVQRTCNFLFMCSGYYDYAQGYTPDFAGIEDFAGTVVHPQKWTDDITTAGKRVVVIGSGATAVTLVPALAKTAEHVTMLQRTPTYVVSRPARDAIANRLQRWLPDRAAYGLTRWKNVLLGQAFYQLCQRAPQRMRKLILSGVQQQVGDNVDVQTHFNPPYGPWDQRLCLVPDADLFAVLRSGRACVVTDQIERVVADGITLRGGEHLPADVIVTATGLKLQIMGGAEISVDGQTVRPRDVMGYKAIMFSDVPNLAMCFGYTNASWTLKADLTSAYVCRVLNHMRAAGQRICVPRQRDASIETRDFIDLKAGYIRRALDELPRAGSKRPWRLRQNYFLDLLNLRWARIDDGVLEFS